MACLDEAREYTTGDRDGLHIHLSKKGMTDSHKVRFGAFVAEYQNEIVTIARRRSDWSTYIDRATNGREAAAMASNHGSRYEAVNWYNPSTVELRIFPWSSTLALNFPMPSTNSQSAWWASWKL